MTQKLFSLHKTFTLPIDISTLKKAFEMHIKNIMFDTDKVLDVSYVNETKKGKRKETKNEWLDLGYYCDQNGPHAEKCLGIVKNPTNNDINFPENISEMLNDLMMQQENNVTIKSLQVKAHS